MMTNLAGQLPALVLADREEAFSSAVSREDTSTQTSTKWRKSIGQGGSGVFRCGTNPQSLLQMLSHDGLLTGQGVALGTRVALQV
jgi:hypothetical protein